MTVIFRVCVLLCAGAISGASVSGQATSADEQLARRQLESGRAFARQGNWAEALKDFRAIAETLSATSVADDALLEIARYHLDVAGEPAQAAAAIDTILKNYTTSDSASDAYVMAGRIALGRGHQEAEIDEALANFGRVSSMFPGSPAEPRALQLAGQALWYAGRYDEALASVSRVTSEFPASPAAAAAHLTAGRVLLALGRPILAMEELQQVRNRWPDSDAAQAALADITLLHRLYVRVPARPAYGLAAAEQVGPARLRDVQALVRAADGRLYWADNSNVGVVDATPADRMPAFSRLRGLTQDAAGSPVAIDSASLKPLAGGTIPVLLPEGDGRSRALDNIVAARQLSTGHWLIMDNDQRAIQRFGPDGSYVSSFAEVRVTRLAVGTGDQVAGISRDGREVLVFGPGGNTTARIPLRSGGIDFRNPADVAFDGFGHLYVLDREALAVFSPHPVPDGRGASDTRDQAGRASGRYTLRTTFSADRQAGGFDRATAFVLDRAGTIFLHDDRVQRILVYR